MTTEVEQNANLDSWSKFCIGIPILPFELLRRKLIAFALSCPAWKSAWPDTDAEDLAQDTITEIPRLKIRYPAATDRERQLILFGIIHRKIQRKRESDRIEPRDPTQEAIANLRLLDDQVLDEIHGNTLFHAKLALPRCLEKLAQNNPKGHRLLVGFHLEKSSLKELSTGLALSSSQACKLRKNAEWQLLQLMKQEMRNSGWSATPAH